MLYVDYISLRLEERNNALIKLTWASQVAQMVKHLPALKETQV